MSHKRRVLKKGGADLYRCRRSEIDYFDDRYPCRHPIYIDQPREDVMKEMLDNVS